MQTTKWGPSGWRLLNSIVSNYPNHPVTSEKNLFRCFFYCLANVLPCIHCRISYRQFISDLPIKCWLKNKCTLQYYLYLIHNKVNDKLRKQGYLHTDNPRFSKVKKHYDSIRGYDDCGWDFLYAIIYNYPIIPKNVDKYNYRLFYSKLTSLLPYEPVKLLYQKLYNLEPIDNWLDNRNMATKWFYKIHRKILSELGEQHNELLSYSEISEKYENFRASCVSSVTNSCRLPNKI